MRWGDPGLSKEFSGDEGDDEGESVMGDDSEISTRDGVVTCWEGEMMEVMASMRRAKNRRISTMR